MVLFPNCKINLGLNIVRKRPDGYHDLETVFYPIAFPDALEVIRNDHPSGDISFSSTGFEIKGDSENNLCIKAYHLLKKDFSQLPPVKVHLHKCIPAGGGLGGGSADGAFMLRLLNQKFNLGLSKEALISYALQLGSDCPFFIINKPCFATGRGEALEQIELDLSAYKFILVNPNVHVSTAEAFSLLTPIPPLKSIKHIIHQPVETWKAELKNDFEAAVFEIHPEIKSIKEALYEQGAIYASMTGSGSTVYGIFRKGLTLAFNFSSDYFVKELVG